jgi:hypothetical protein
MVERAQSSVYVPMRKLQYVYIVGKDGTRRDIAGLSYEDIYGMCQEVEVVER